MSARYEFLTISKDKRKGPFLVRRNGVAIGYGYRTAKVAAEKAKLSEEFVDRVIAEALLKLKGRKPPA